MYQIYDVYLKQSFYFRSGSTFTADLDFVKMKNEDIGL